MNALFAGGPASVSEILERMTDPPSYSSVRATLRVLEDKGHVQHDYEGRSYVYRPTLEPERARRAALTELVQTYFDGSAENAAAALLRMSDTRIERATVERLAGEIERAQREGR